MAEAPIPLVDLEGNSPGPDRSDCRRSGDDTLPENFSPTGPIESRQEFSLPPVDGGKDAWLFLAACFSLEALIWGFPFSFGVFQDYYSNSPTFAGSGNIAVIGTCAMGIMYLDVPMIMALLRIYPHQGRRSPIFGLLIMCLSLAMSSFSTNVTHLIVTQGIFYAIGGSIAYSPCIVYLDEWFVKRKGLAYGIMWSGTGLAGFSLPLLLQYLLSVFDFRQTLRIWAGVAFILTAPLAFFIKPRIPISTSTPRARPFNLRFICTRVFILHQLANVCEALGFFIPGIYLPSYARRALGATLFPSALTVLLLNVASVFGCVAMGSLTDRLHVTTCIFISTVGATAGVFLLWGFASSLPVLYLFCIVYGAFAGSFTSTWTGIMRDVASQGGGSDRDSDAAGGPTGGGGSFDPGMVFAFLATGRGVGNVVSGPLSESLVKGMPWKGGAVGGYGTGFGALIVFTGATAFVGGGSFVWRKIGWL